MAQRQLLHFIQRQVTRRIWPAGHLGFRFKTICSPVQSPWLQNVTRNHTVWPSAQASVARKTSGPGVESVAVNPKGETVMVRWNDGFQTEFHAVWLRFNCHCKACRHANGQKLLDPTSIPASIHMDSVISEGDHLNISWNGSEGSHNGCLPVTFLRDSNYSMETMIAKRQAVKCDRPVAKIPFFSYEDIMTSKNARLRWLPQINEAGLSIVQGVPTEEHQVTKVAELIGPVWTSIYGVTFDVKAVKDPINLAFSEMHLDLHQDLAYFESPPGIQLLHCLQFDECTEGGETVFLDAFPIAEAFRINFPHLFHTLTTVPATFQKVHYEREYPVHIVNQKPHIKLNHLGEIVAVYWAPAFEGPLSVEGADVERYYRAYEMFAKSVEESPHKLRHRLQPGEAAVFNNLRMVHGRQSYKLNGGMRHMEVCYVNIDFFKSMVQVQNNLVGDGRLAKRVGNQCWF